MKSHWLKQEHWHEVGDHCFCQILTWNKCYIKLSMTFLKALLTFEAGGEVISSPGFALFFFPGCLKRHQRNNRRWRTGLWRDCIASCRCLVMDSTIMNSLAEENMRNAIFTNQTIFLDIAESVNQLSAALWVLNIFLLFRKSSTNMQSS